MNATLICYLVYLTIAIFITCFVGRTCFRYGRVFLIDIFAGDHALADSTNRLLLTGFYLVNFSYALLTLTWGETVTNLTSFVERLSWSVGLLALILGTMHFLNVTVLLCLRRRFRRRRQHEPALEITEFFD